MKIGTLNELISLELGAVRFAGSREVLQPQETGNPLKGESLSFNWQQLRDQPVAVEICFSQKAFADTLVLELGGETKLTAAVVTDGQQVLYAHRAETGKTISSNRLELVAGVMTDKLELQLEGYYSNIQLDKITVYGAVEDGIDLFPIPKKAVAAGEMIPVADFACCSADSADGVQAAAILAEKYQEITGISLATGDNGQIRFITDGTIPADGYALTFAAGQAQIAASNLRGFVCGAECFIKLTSPKGVQACNVSDAPDRPFRGVHLFLPALHEMTFAKRLIKYLISPMGYNNVIIEVAGAMRFDRHPEINAAFLEGVEKGKQGIWPPFPHGSVADGTVVEKDTVRELVAYIRSFGIEPVPEIQSLGHVQFMTQAYPEIAEREDKNYNDGIDTRGEDSRPAEFYAHCYCPSNEKSYQVLFDIIDEIVEVFQPRSYVHMGHDEVYQIGICPICRTKDPADLYAYDVNRIHGYLAQKGLKMMIWSDMLQPCTRYKTPPAIRKIPKDILMLDFIWYFHFDKDLEDNLLAEDLTVAVGNLYSSHYPRYESRMAKKGMVGGQISTWVGTNEESIQQEGKFFDMFLTANMLWNADSYNHCHNRLYDRMISARMPGLREQLRQIRYPSRMENAQVTLLAENPVSFPPVNPRQNTGFAVDVPCDSLLLYHTCLRKLTRYPWTKNAVVGQYVLTYADGSQEQVDITSGGNIGYWNRRQNGVLTHQVYRHNGYTTGYYTDGIASKTMDGGDVTVYRLEHLLPAGKQLVRVQLVEDPEADAQIFLCKAEAVKA